MKLTQADIEDIAVYAAQRGVYVLELGIPRTMLAEYNREVFAKERIVLSGTPSKSEPLTKQQTALHSIILTPVDD